MDAKSQEVLTRVGYLHGFIVPPHRLPISFKRKIVLLQWRNWQSSKILVFTLYLLKLITDVVV